MQNEKYKKESPKTRPSKESIPFFQTIWTLHPQVSELRGSLDMNKGENFFSERLETYIRKLSDQGNFHAQKRI